MKAGTPRVRRGDQEKTTEIPQIMRAAALDHFGGPDVLKVRSLPTPQPDKGEVLIAVDTAGVGVWDADMRAGWSPGGRVNFPLVLGTDGSGTIAATGSGMRRLHVGDSVYSYSFANPKGGFYAEYVAVAAEKVAPIPRGLELMQAGAIAATGLTALQGVDDALKIESGDTVLIHGAAGGVGSLAVQFAKLREARVIATAKREDGVAFVRRLGADTILDGDREDIADAIRDIAPHGVSAVLALSGGEALDRCLKAVKSGGRVAYPNGIEPEPEKRRGLQITGYDAVSGVEEFARLNLAVEAAKIQVPIAASYALGDAARAHERLAAGHVLGRIVLRAQS